MFIQVQCHLQSFKHPYPDAEIRTNLNFCSADPVLCRKNNLFWDHINNSVGRIIDQNTTNLINNPILHWTLYCSPDCISSWIGHLYIHEHHQQSNTDLYENNTNLVSVITKRLNLPSHFINSISLSNYTVLLFPKEQKTRISSSHLQKPGKSMNAQTLPNPQTNGRASRRYECTTRPERFLE